MSHQRGRDRQAHHLSSIEVDSSPLDGDEESFNSGSRKWASQCCVVVSMPGAPAQPSVMVQAAWKSCVLHIRSTFATFHLKSQRGRTKLSLTNKCLPWHPNAARRAEHPLAWPELDEQQTLDEKEALQLSLCTLCRPAGKEQLVAALSTGKAGWHGLAVIALCKGVKDGQQDRDGWFPRQRGPRAVLKAGTARTHDAEWRCG